MTKGINMIARNTPGLSNAENVSLSVGDEVTYDLGDGTTVSVTITSSYAQHDNGAYGYEGRFADDGQIGFMDERRIIEWPGKPEAKKAR